MRRFIGRGYPQPYRCSWTARLRAKLEVRMTACIEQAWRIREVSIPVKTRMYSGRYSAVAIL
jgi:hypothetical protein